MASAIDRVQAARKKLDEIRHTITTDALGTLASTMASAARSVAVLRAASGPVPEDKIKQLKLNIGGVMTRARERASKVFLQLNELWPHEQQNPPDQIKIEKVSAGFEQNLVELRDDFNNTVRACGFKPPEDILKPWLAKTFAPYEKAYTEWRKALKDWEQEQKTERERAAADAWDKS
jgi:hypothetical protein